MHSWPLSRETNDDEDEEEKEAAGGDDKREKGAKGAEENAIFFPAAQETSEAERTAICEVLDQYVEKKKLPALHSPLLCMVDHQFWIGRMEASSSRSPPSPSLWAVQRCSHGRPTAILSTRRAVPTGGL
jgi:hypothetical protein